MNLRCARKVLLSMMTEAGHAHANLGVYIDSPNLTQNIQKNAGITM